MGRIVVIGASGHGKVVLDAIERQGEHRVVGVLDDGKSAGTDHFGAPILGPSADLARLAGEVDGYFVAVGDGPTRERLAAEARAACPSLAFVTVVHPSAVIARGVSVGAGSAVFAGAVLQPGARVGAGCIVNTRASVDHDAVLEDYASIAPGVSLGGGVTLEWHAFVGIGASVAHGRRIGEHAVVGAGAAVVADVPPRSVAVGVPARVVRSRRPGERYL